MSIHICQICGYIYDPEVGDPGAGIGAGTASNLTDAIGQIMSDLSEGEVPRILITGSLYLVGEVLKKNS